MRILFIAFITCLAMVPNLSAEPIPIWPEGAPGAFGSDEKDIPTLTAYLPTEAHSNGSSFVVLAGGGYGGLSRHEGEGYARWLAAEGIAAYVLKYRLGSAGYHHPVMLQDAARAVRLVRAWARRDGRDPARIGIIGSSAGGHLASTLLVHHDAGQADSADPIERESSRPDIGALCYPVITTGQFTHRGSIKNLLGDSPSPEVLQYLSTELQVNADTPPTFLWHTVEDPVVPVENSLLFATALRKAKVPFELHLYEKGAHGLGLPASGKSMPPWDEDLLRWLRIHAFVR